MPGRLEIVLAVHEQLGNIDRVEFVNCVAELTIDANVPAFSQQRLYIVPAERTQDFADLIP